MIPVVVEDWTPGNDNTEVEIDEEGSGEWWDNLSAMEVALIALLTVMILLLSMVIIGRMRKSNYNPLDYATPNWELQNEDWSDDSYATPMAPEVDFGETLMPAADSIRSTSMPAPTPQNNVPMDDLESLAGDLLDAPMNTKSDDPFNLDDLL